MHVTLPVSKRSWLVSLIGRVPHWYRRSEGLESWIKLNCFQAFLSQVEKLRI